MFRRRGKARWGCWVLLLGSLALLCPVCSYLVVLSKYPGFDIRLDPIGEKLRELESAKALWEKRSFLSYRLVVENGKCLQDVEIRNEAVTQVHSNPCKWPPVTIADLFSTLERDVPELDWHNGVGCDLLVANAHYNPVQGYPQTITYLHERANPSNIGGLNSIIYLNNPFRFCTLMGFWREGYTVLSLTPLP